MGLTHIEARVHDPSIFRVGDMFYVFGSHMAMAKSRDLIAWEQIATHVHEGNPLMRHPDDFREAFEWSESRTFWAGDIEPMPDGRYFMYYCNCQGGKPLGDIGLAISESLEGPYTNQGIFLKSGMEGVSEDGTIYDATIHPNCVDPHAFFDHDGVFWLLYGSFSGGIFIMRLDPETGLPFPGQGYGKKLMGGNHARIEGPYMLYSPETKYYYLFVTYGGLMHHEGYNMRIARSRCVTGPFVDAAGQDITDVKGEDGTYFDDRSIEGYGTKLMGSYWFMQELGESGGTTGHISPGHNSAYFDRETGRYFLIFHQRFAHSRSIHQVRVHEMFLTDDGWFVVSPFRYSNTAQRSFVPDDIHGQWKIICHGQDINYIPNISATVQFNADGTIDGQRSGYKGGTWRLGDDGCIVVSLTGRAFVPKGNNPNTFIDPAIHADTTENAYAGRVLLNFAQDHDRVVTSFAAMSADGVALWGQKVICE